MSTNGLARKLQIKPGYKLGIINAPAGFAERLEPLPPGAEIVADQSTALDAVLLFVRDMADVDRLASTAAVAVKSDGLLWISYPKGGAKAGTDLSRDILFQRLSRDGLSGVSLVAIDDTWSAMRFRPADRVGTARA